MQTDENTKNLRSQHFDFGQEKVPWKSINREVFTPKKLDNNRYNSKLNELIRRGNIQKPEENRDFTSETMLSYSKKPLVNNSLSKEYKENLRKNHFDFGDNNFKENANTVNREDFKDPRLNKNYNYEREIDEKYIYRKDYYIMDFKGNFLNWLLEELQSLIDNCKFCKKFGKTNFHIANRELYGGNPKEEANREFIDKTIEEVFTLTEEQKLKNQQKRVNR